MERIKIYNGRVITPYRIIEDGCIIVEDGRISYVGCAKEECCDCIEIDAKGSYVSPGFIDIHTHGGGGSDFMDGTEEAFLIASRVHSRHGTTAMVPTTLTSTNEELINSFEVFKRVKSRKTMGAQLLGLHLEGPYFSMEQRGAQDPRYIRNPDPSEYLSILSQSDDIVRWSAAPELDGSLEFGRCMKENGILASIAHSDAIYAHVQDAFENGFTHVTHLYSGMSGVRRINAYRHAGVIESAFLIDGMTVEIIADGVHLPASLLKLIYKIKGPDSIALVTDSMRAAGMPEGESVLGSLKDGQKVMIEDGVAKLLDRSAFAGSVATADRLVRTMTYTAEVPLTDVVTMMTATPAKIIGIDNRKGTICAGKDADIIIFDKDINIIMTMVQGRIIWSSQANFRGGSLNE